MFIKANSIPHGNTSLPLADESVDCIVTSPPYWGLRRYGSSPEEFGCGSLGEYLSDWLRLSSELWRVLKRDGTFWLNIGDTACVDTETMIFTQRGWLTVNDVRIGDMTLTLNEATGEAEWGQILDLHISDSSVFPMLSMQSERGHSSLTTLNHRWLVERRTTNSGIRQSRPGVMNGSAKLNDASINLIHSLRSEGMKQIEIAKILGVSCSAVSKVLTGRTWTSGLAVEVDRDAAGKIKRERVVDWVSSSDVAITDCRVPVSRCVSNLPKVKIHEDALVEAVAWYWTEGHDRSTYGGKGLWITQSVKVHPEFCNEITDCLKRLFGSKSSNLVSKQEKLWRIDESRKETDGVLVWKLNGLAAEEIRTHAPDKAVTTEFLCSLTKEQLDLFIDVSIKGDGHVCPDGTIVLPQSNQSDNSTRARKRAESFHYAVTLAGRYATLLSRPSSPDIRDSRNWIPHDIWTVYIGKKKYFMPSKTQSSVVPYCGKVWCPTTANGSWLAMRNGVPFFTGNSGSGGAGGDYNKSGAKSHIPKYKQGDSWLRRHQWGNIPAILTTSMQMEPAPGTQDAKKTPMWLLRSEIIWDKSPKVERCAGDHVRRPKVSHEKIYMFAKSDDYKFYFDRLVEPGSVWHFDPNRTGDKGYAPFPDELAYRCIMPSTDIGDVVLDPFSGSGTTVYVAESNCRTGIGLELYL